MPGWSLSQAAGWGLLVSLGLMTMVWLGSLIRRDASLVDRFWGVGFVVLGWFYWRTAPAGGATAVRALAVGLVTAWGLRLSAYLSWRNWGNGEDYRYQAMRRRGGRWFPLVNLVTVHYLQGLIMWFVALPLMVAARGAASWEIPAVWVGGALWTIGFGFEAIGDWQLIRFKADPANRGRVLDRGLWRYTRHPNYFGDACVWWGIYLLGAAAGGWWTAVSPLIMTGLLVKVSGVALLEKQLERTKPQYRDYIARTSSFFPRPPRPPA